MRLTHALPLFAVSASVLVIRACGGGSAGDDIAVVDSAGVQVVINPVVNGVRSRAFLADSPRIVLGGVRGNLGEEFVGMSGYPAAVRLTNGRIVAHDKTHLKLFDADGRLLRVVGRAGDGPGEFRDVQGLCPFRADSVLVTDQRGRVVILDANGTIAREYTPPGWVLPNVCFEDGTAVASGSRLPDAGGVLRLNAYKLVSSSGVVVHHLPPLPTSVYTPIERVVSYAVHNDELYVGDPMEMAVKVYDRTGALRRIVRTRDVPEPISQRELEAMMPEAEAGSSARPQPADRAEGATRPMYSKMGVDGHGRIWLRTTDHRGFDDTWVIFSADGRLLARLNMIEDRKSLRPATEPWAGRRIISFGADEVVIFDHDDMGAQRFSFVRVRVLER